MKKALVLGGSGFIGKHLIGELVKNQIEVTALVHKNPLSFTGQGIKITQGSLEDFNWQTLEGSLPDVIFHTARMGGKDKKSRAAAAQRNKAGNERLLSWLKTLQAPPLLVFVSGTLVYGSNGRDKTDENAPPAPISFQKEYFEAEKPILQALKDSSLPITIVRPSWVYGLESWFQAFYLNYMKKKQKVPVYGRGNNLMAFIHVRDAAAMMIYAAKYSEKNTVYNLFTTPAISQKKFTQILAKHSGLPVKKIPNWWIKLRFDKAVSEAFSFSLNLRTKHMSLWEGYNPYYADIEVWFREIFSE